MRIVLDCLSENVERISSSETGIATIGEIEQKIANLVRRALSRRRLIPGMLERGSPREDSL
jgi:hypothetical protein